MSDITSLVDELIAAGTPPGLAASVVARAIVIGKDAAPFRNDLPDTRSKAAIRQQRYRDNRNAASRNVTDGVTQRNDNSVTQNVTNRNENITERNENVTPLRSENSDISYLPSSLSIQEKKESKKERKYRKRNAPLPDDWHPSLRSRQIGEEHGQNVQLVEQIFRDYLKSSGRLYADYDAAFNNFIRNQKKFNGSANYGKTQSRSGGSLIDAIDRQLAAAELSQKPDLTLPADSILSLPDRSIRRS